MRVIFSKANNERLPEFDIITKIVVDDAGKRFALKEPVSPLAAPHMKSIYENYKTVQEKYENIKLAKATLKDDVIQFEMARGDSMERLLLDALRKRNNNEVDRLLGLYDNLLESMVEARNTQFTPTEEFIDIFGEWQVDTPQDIIETANIDLLFSNIFIDDSDNIEIIDYEWIFHFPIPKSFIAWRAFNIFNHFNGRNLVEKDSRGLSKHDKCFKKMEYNFCAKVYGKGFERPVERTLLKSRTEALFTNDLIARVIGAKTLFYSTYILKKIVNYLSR